jgi:hypothetical protein
MSWTDWFRTLLILLLVLIALILVRYDAAGQRAIETGQKLTSPHDLSDWPKSAPTLMSK